MLVGSSGCTFVFAFSRGNPPHVDRWVDTPGGGGGGMFLSVGREDGRG